MRFLLDTHLLLWASDYARKADRMSREAADVIADVQHQLHFSVASIWEVAIKRSRMKPEFTTDPLALRFGLLDNGYLEVLIASEHAVAAGGLPAIHRDPFDRMMIAQAQVEGLTLLTADATIARYPGPIRLV